MNRRIFVAFILTLSLAIPALAASRVYRYRCPKCKLIQEYEIQGTKKCPNDGRIMIKIN